MHPSLPCKQFSDYYPSCTTLSDRDTRKNKCVNPEYPYGRNVNNYATENVQGALMKAYHRVGGETQRKEYLILAGGKRLSQKDQMKRNNTPSLPKWVRTL